MTKTSFYRFFKQNINKALLETLSSLFYVVYDISVSATKTWQGCIQNEFHTGPLTGMGTQKNVPQKMKLNSWH